MSDFTMSRRTLLSGVALAGAASLAPALPAQAAAEMQGLSVPSVYRFKMGDFEITTIRDGGVALDGPHPIFGQNVDASEVQALAEENFLPPTRMEIGFTVTLVNTGAELVLFDTGNGDTGRRPAAGLLLDHLAAAGISPEDIDIVVITHFHGDHIGGLTEGGSPAFPNARYVTGATEYDFWTGDAAAGNDALANSVKLVQAKVVPMAEKMTFVAPGDAVVSGIEAVNAFGHTPGHMAYRIESGGQNLILTADTVNHFVVSLQRPDWHVRFDMDKEAAANTRRELLGMIASERLPFIGYHMPAPALGYLEPYDGSFRYVAASYQFHV
ncbi:MBL fold metallo-hydrolase [Oceanomicrobium pacificus]|uniref:MBL fold metallo-hydrolase n=1 Tax=Oceanomicrobium pacificus TaxID=2692916 RepID=A0A6B0TN64_9RHOB|nr:MBL fold metallo-hydrolase [Oceanomicrobium pacificus]MXU65977.1 MBL fold metallo-hydrolase [Oceanomicrobium pacificus]